MTKPFWCLSILLLLPYVLAKLGGYYKIRQFGALYNHHPRSQAAERGGIGARVWAAQQTARKRSRCSWRTRSGPTRAHRRGRPSS